MKDYYQILEVEPHAPQDKIKEQYLLLIQAWHPDKFPNPAHKAQAEEKTKDINAAYEVLGNAAKRAEYDRNTPFARLHQDRKYPRQEAQATHQKEDQGQNEQANGERAKAAIRSIRVFIDGQERTLRVDELVKARVQYFDKETKEDMGFDYFRTHAAVRAAAARCLKSGVEIHVRQLAP